MKNLAAILSCGILLFSCCSKKEQPADNSAQNESVIVKPSYAVDSLKVEDSVAVNPNLTAFFKKQILVFPTSDKALLDSIYSPANLKLTSYELDSLKAGLEKVKQNYFTDIKEDAKDWEYDSKRIWDENSAMKVVSHNGNLLTIQYSGGGFSGGAHGYYFENYKVFDLESKKVISLNDIFQNPKDAVWNDILMKNFTDKDQKEMLLEDKIAPNNNFYFDNNGITFVYNQYEITAYAAGLVYINLKFNDIKDQLKPEFLKKYNIK
ncbi:MAG: RsiV family protein [Bergeyella sp.]